MKIRNIKTIIKKELANYYNNISFYIVLVVFLLLWQFLFFRSALLIGEASVRGLFDILPYVALILIPAVTMGVINRETEDGTLEILLTSPVKDLEVIIGKWLSSSLFVFSALIFAFPIAFSISLFGRFDWGIFAGQLIGSFLFTFAFAALGVFISSFIGNAVASLLTTVAIGFFLIISGTEFVTANLPLSLVPFFERLSFISHLQSLSRGVVDTRDVWYFLSFSGAFLGLTYLQFMKRRYGNVKEKFQTFKIGIGLFIGIAVLTNIVGERIPGRIDLSSGKNYTLASGTKKVLGNLPDVVTITLYASSKLPPQYAPIVRETKDMLADFKKSAKDNLNIVLKDPSGNEQEKEEAASRGIQEVQFNVIGSEEFQLKTGYLGLSMDYGGENESIPFIRSTDDLEYQLTSNIQKLTSKEKKIVSLTSGHGEKDLYADLSVLNKELAKQFDLQTGDQIATGASALVVIGSTGKFSDDLISSIKNFLKEGKNAIFWIDGYSVSPQMPTATVIEDNVNDILKDYGVNLDKNLVYDLKANEVVSFGSGRMNYLIPYPFWLRGIVARANSPLTAKVDSLFLPWTSSISLDENKAKESGYKVTKLITTTDSASEKTGSINIAPNNADFAKENLKEYNLAILLEPIDEKKMGKVLVVGDADFATDQFLQNAPENLVFAVNSISYMASSEELSTITTRRNAFGRLVFRSEIDPLFVKYGNMALAFLTPLVFGGFRLLRRRSDRFLQYQKT